MAQPMLVTELMEHEMPRPADLRDTPFSPRYPQQIDEWIDVYGYAVPLWITDPESEYDAVRTRAGALEYSMLYKWHVEGLGAAETVDAVVSRDVTKVAPGRIAYGFIASDEGTMIDDVTIAVQSEQHVIVTGGNQRTFASLTAAAKPGVRVTERRDESAVLSLQGPTSRSILSALTDADLSNEGLPYYSFLSGLRIAGIEASINRVGFTAELGYEIIVKRDQALQLWDAVMLAGAPFGIQPIAAAALMMCRIEAGMIMGELDYDDTVSPFECRMGWAIDDKGPFQGSSALTSRRETDSGRVVTLLVDASPQDAEGARLELDGVDVGYVSMAVPSPVLAGATIAMARVHRDASAVEASLVVVGPNAMSTAQVISTPVYDPERRRVRS